MNITIDQQEREDLIHGLQIRIYVIETGTTNMRTNDAINCGQPKLIKPLSDSQRELIARHEALIQKLLKAR